MRIDIEIGEEERLYEKEAAYDEKPRRDTSFRLNDLVNVATAIAFPILLSANGVLPPSLWIAAKVGSAWFVGKAVVWIALFQLMPEKSEPEEVQNYPQIIRSLHPWKSCILVPLVEEVLFRGMLQRGTKLLFELYSRGEVRLFGRLISQASLVSALVAGILFGLAHTQNDWSEAKLQGIVTGIAGIFEYGYLFATFGLPASFIAHALNNLLAECLRMAVEVGAQMGGRTLAEA